MYNTGERSEPEKNNLWTSSPSHQTSTQDPISEKSQGEGGGGPPVPPLNLLNPHMKRGTVSIMPLLCLFIRQKLYRLHSI